ncbi:predicted permease FtsX [Dinoroseobacter shibae DFL 12 = DSM 16493]|jgi:putative ABC transport system permease protein|uniref:Predicted permease FtsX n=1 Tax=Dinoroseobacter shibae (strain DSM 16493 / NCIMB 14021 / DFL 12) TaxID=398580 RepID=A8LNJ2_DINSH|nr:MULTISPECIES: FtsX-like permease family protein [Dinoroseobacter]ABV95086.1 predicted permease FtsX [Dinoroseobacter shibae DFL 12 = DSM 16493]MDD9717791.1 FtsX-like permease family protein [Dinoroseobacter sp. PD6]URF46502.1 FtsX-like permease family protein [Dinoroseobacter shibae]URF50808.1 FtsX-like permease family protein [Dinoroseobacter shibae]
MHRTALSAMLAHWRRHPGQLLTLLLGLALATALWSGVQAINAEARSSYATAAAALGQDELNQLVDPSGPIPEATYIALRRAGWGVSPVLEGRITRDIGIITILGIDPITAPPAAQMVDLSAPGDLAAFIAGQAYAPPELAARLGVAFEGQPVRQALGLPAGTLLMDMGQAQRVLDRPDQVTRLLLWPDQPLTRVPLAEIAPELTEAAPEDRGDVARLTDSFHLNLTAFGFLSFAVGLFIVHAAIGLAFEQRRPTFRTLRALGVPARSLVGLLAAEVLLLSLLAGAVGVALGYLIAATLLPDVAATLQGLYGASVDGALSLAPSWWFLGLAISVLGAAAAAAQSLWRLWHLPVLAPAQPRAWARASDRAMRRQGLLAAGMIVVGLGLLLWGSGLVVAFVMLALLLLGAALALPVLLSGALALGARTASSVLGEWFWADTRQQLPGLSLALMALLLALSANIGVGTMVGSFRLTFTGWLDQRLASELYVTARSEAEAAEMRAFLAPKVDALLPIWSVEAPLPGGPGEIFGVADHPTYRDYWPLLSALPDVWDRVAEGSGVLVNEQLARREGLRPGDTIPLPGNWEAEVAGIYSDYGNPRGQVMIGLSAFETRFPEAAQLRYAVRLDPDRTETVMEDLQSEFGLPASTMIDQATVKAFSLAVFERTFTVTAALNVLTLGVAAVAMLASLMTLARMRLPQLAPVWALGLTRARLARLELARAALLAALTAVLALPVGLVLAWALLAVVNVEAFGWRLPMHLFPGDWLRLGILALLAALLASAWPVLRLARTAPSDLLKVFANER